jgi:hypothetical protein
MPNAPKTFKETPAVKDGASTNEQLINKIQLVLHAQHSLTSKMKDGE